jgi:hypothetical protein
MGQKPTGGLVKLSSALSAKAEMRDEHEIDQRVLSVGNKNPELAAPGLCFELGAHKRLKSPELLPGWDQLPGFHVFEPLGNRTLVDLQRSARAC